MKKIRMQAKRISDSPTSGLEKKLLNFLAARMPVWVNSDRLTGLGLLASFLTGLSYYLSQFDETFLFWASFFIFLNWFGDSLDGTLARFRGLSRERYGYYVDHIMDTFSSLFIGIGFAFSQIIHPYIALGILVCYLMIAINSYLIAYTNGIFFLSYEHIGPTEFRILTIIFNLVVYFIQKPTLTIFEKNFYVFDLLGIMVAFSFLRLLLVNVFRNLRHLSREEKVE